MIELEIRANETLFYKVNIATLGPTLVIWYLFNICILCTTYHKPNWNKSINQSAFDCDIEPQLTSEDFF